MEKKMGVRELYETALHLTMHAEKVRGDRFNLYLLVNSFLIVAWSTIFVATPSLARTLAMLILLTMGFFGGLVWAALARRTRRYLENYYAQCREIELAGAKFWENDVLELKPKLTHSNEVIDPLPFKSGEPIRNEASLARMGSVVFWTPLVFSSVYFILGLLSLCPCFRQIGP